MSDEQFFPRRGVPTKPDVDRLVARWPMETLKPGQVFLDTDIADVLGIPRQGDTFARFNTVVTAWIHRVEDATALVIERQRNGDCLKVQKPMEVFHASDKKVGSAYRSIRLQLKRVASTEVQNEDERRHQMHRAGWLAKLESTLSRVKKQIPRLPRQERLPK